jgi:hypothetical protein
MLDREGLLLSKPKPGFTLGWTHLLMHELDVNRRLTHESYVVDHACMRHHRISRLHRPTPRFGVEVAISVLTLSVVCVETDYGHQVYMSGSCEHLAL